MSVATARCHARQSGRPWIQPSSASAECRNMSSTLARHGPSIQRSAGTLSFHIASLYPTLYRLERRGLIVGRWLEQPGRRRRRYYRLTPAGRKVLAEQRGVWGTFFLALQRVAGVKAVEP